MEGVNLADSRLGTTVCCDCPGGEAGKGAGLAASTGWMADSWVRAPAALTLHLPLPVTLASLDWVTRLGEQSCSLHEVLTSRDPAMLADNTGCTCTSASPPDTGWSSVGRGMAENGRIAFRNRRVGGAGGGEGELRLGGGRADRGALDCVTAVRIRVLRTERNTVPCLATLRLTAATTGQPGEAALLTRAGQLGTPAAKQLSFFGGAEVDSDDEVTVVEKETEQERVSGEERRVRSVTDIEEEIPEDFLDAITHSLMTVPMVLPGGCVVDRTTLDRCQDMFSTWGGQPRDPFTGKLFTVSSRPQFSPGLKARIDSWLAGGAGRGAGAGRTLGSARAIQQFLSSQLGDSPGLTPAKLRRLQ